MDDSENSIRFDWYRALRHSVATFLVVLFLMSFLVYFFFDFDPPYEEGSSSIHLLGVDVSADIIADVAIWFSAFAAAAIEFYCKYARHRHSI